MFDEFLEDYKYNWKMADKKYMEECYRKSLSPKQVEKAKNSQMISIFLKIKWMWENLKNSIEAARFPEILALAIAVFLISLILLIVLAGKWRIKSIWKNVTEKVCHQSKLKKQKTVR